MTPGIGQALFAMLCFGMGDLIYKRAAGAGIAARHFIMLQAWFFCPLITLYALVTGGNPLGLLSSSHRDAALARLSPPIAAVVEVATRPFANDRFVDARQMALALADALEATDPTGD